MTFWESLLGGIQPCIIWRHSLLLREQLIANGYQPGIEVLEGWRNNTFVQAPLRTLFLCPGPQRDLQGISLRQQQHTASHPNLHQVTAYRVIQGDTGDTSEVQKVKLGWVWGIWDDHSSSQGFPNFNFLRRGGRVKERQCQHIFLQSIMRPFFWRIDIHLEFFCRI